MRAKDVVFIGTMAAILLTVQVALGFLPNIELVSLLIILCTLVYGWKTLYIIYIFVFAEGFLYGFGLWWINYLYVWIILMLLIMVFRAKNSPYFWAVFSGFFGLGFGALCSISYLFIGGVPMALSYWTSGILFDVIHCIGNFIITLVLYRPLRNLLDRINRRWNVPQDR